jgi:hypothetical protein
MKDLVTLWKHTRMVVLVALTAAVYARLRGYGEVLPRL